MPFRNRLTILLTSQFFYLAVLSQTANQGKLFMNIGGGAAILNMSSNLNVGENGIAIPKQKHVSLGCTVKNQIGIGLEIHSNNYLTNDSSINVIFGGASGLKLEYYFYNKMKSNAYFGTSMGRYNIDFDLNVEPDSASADQSTKPLYLRGGGTYNSIFIGYNRLFGNFFGLYSKVGFLNQPYNMWYAKFDGKELEEHNGILIEDWNLLMRGFFLHVGCYFKLFDKNKSKIIENELSSGDK